MEKQIGKGLEALIEHHNMQTNTTHEHLQVIFGELSVLRAEARSGDASQRLWQLEAKMNELHGVVAQAMTIKDTSEAPSSVKVEKMYDEVLQMESFIANDLQGVSSNQRWAKGRWAELSPSVRKICSLL